MGQLGAPQLSVRLRCLLKTERPVACARQAIACVRAVLGGGRPRARPCTHTADMPVRSASQPPSLPLLSPPPSPLLGRAAGVRGAVRLRGHRRGAVRGAHAARVSRAPQRQGKGEKGLGACACAGGGGGPVLQQSTCGRATVRQWPKGLTCADRRKPLRGGAQAGCGV